MRRKKTTNHYAKEKSWVFSFDLREESEEKCPKERERKRVPDPRSDELKGSLPHGPLAHPRNTEYLNMQMNNKCIICFVLSCQINIYAHFEPFFMFWSRYLDPFFPVHIVDYQNT